MRTQAEYDAALRQLKRSPADLTDDDIAVFRDRNPGFANLVEESRARHRRGDAYQAKLAAERCSADYEADVRRRAFLQNQNQKEARFIGMGEPRRTPPTKRGVVRLMSDEQLQRLADKSTGVVRIEPKRR